MCNVLANMTFHQMNNGKHSTLFLARPGDLYEVASRNMNNHGQFSNKKANSSMYNI